MRALFIILGMSVLAACAGDDEDGTAGSRTGDKDPVTNVPTGSARVALDVKSFCQKATTGCGDSSIKASDCEAMFAAVRVTKDCAAALEGASCKDLTGGSGAVSSCFPSCSSPGATACNPDGTLTVCGDASRALVYDCQTMCSQVGKSGAGKCGASSDSQGGSGGGQEKCICQ